jgi:poly(hydroxyalkanoate) depolymerase family esterase
VKGWAGRPQPLAYRIYSPTGTAQNTSRPLLVALHGCTQTAADFAAGTRFDALADEHDLVVLYPEQSPFANPQRCWNWFLEEHQSRDRGEPAAILDLIARVSLQRNVDRERIFVCGLSAGAALAAILAEQAPDVFAAVGIMSGVALHTSHDLRSAREAMRGEREYAPIGALLRTPPVRSYERLRAMIWAGEEDTTVDPSNALALADQFRALLALRETPESRVETAEGTIIRWSDRAGRTRLELRTIDGLGHAWSGGSLRGSQTDPDAPDLSEAMLEFFLEA